jgi:hypothetical protein
VAKSSSVILQTVDAGIFKLPPKAHASNVYVVSYRNGDVRLFSGVPSMVDRGGGSFCYIVDVAERRVTSSSTVTSAADAYSFTVEVAATWKVTDPVAVVRAGLADGDDVVLGCLQDDLWTIGRRYLPEHANAAEAAARDALSGARSLAEGITVLRATARFRADSHLTAAVLDRDTDRHQGSLEEDRLHRLRQWFDGSEESAILLHLLQHRDDTGTVLQMLTDGRDKAQAIRLTLLDRMLEHKLITDADAQPLRDQVLGPAVAPPVTMRPIKARATPLALPPAVAGSVVPDPAQPNTAWLPSAAGPPAPQQPEDQPWQAPPASSPPAGQQPAGQQPVANEDPNSASGSGTRDGNGQAGGVREWKTLRKRPGQEPA